MLRRRIRRVTGSTGQVRSFTHGLGQIPSEWHTESWGTGRGAGRFIVTAVGTNMITIRNTAASSCTVDIFVNWWSDQPY